MTELVPVDPQMIELREEARQRQENVNRLAGIRLIAVYRGQNVLNVPVVDIIGNRDLVRIADDELVGMVEQYLTEDQPERFTGRDCLGKVSVHRPDGENIIVGPVPEFG